MECGSYKKEGVNLDSATVRVQALLPEPLVKLSSTGARENFRLGLRGKAHEGQCLQGGTGKIPHPKGLIGLRLAGC